MLITPLGVPTWLYLSTTQLHQLFVNRDCLLKSCISRQGEAKQHKPAILAVAHIFLRICYLPCLEIEGVLWTGNSV